MNGNSSALLWWWKHRHPCWDLHDPLDCNSKTTRGWSIFIYGSSNLTGLLCVSNWSVHNVMNLYKAISQCEYLSAFPVLTSASHLSHISIISKYNADIQSLDSKPAGTPRHTKSHRMWILNNVLRLLWCMDVHNYTTQDFPLSCAALSGNCPSFWRRRRSIQGGLSKLPPRMIWQTGRSVHLVKRMWRMRIRLALFSSLSKSNDRTQTQHELNLLKPTVFVSKG